MQNSVLQGFRKIKCVSILSVNSPEMKKVHALLQMLEDKRGMFFCFFAKSKSNQTHSWNVLHQPKTICHILTRQTKVGVERDEEDEVV